MERQVGALIRCGMALVMMLFLPGVVRAEPTKVEPPSSASPTLVFVTQSDACDCVANLCVAGEQEVLNFIASNPWGFQRKTVDLAKEPEAAKELRILSVPVVFLLDAHGEQVARFDGYFGQEDFQQAWKSHLHGKGQ